MKCLLFFFCLIFSWISCTVRCREALFFANRQFLSPDRTPLNNQVSNLLPSSTAQKLRSATPAGGVSEGSAISLS
jgi:hypothetical protein